MAMVGLSSKVDRRGRCRTSPRWLRSEFQAGAAGRKRSMRGAAPHICIITPGALGSNPRVVKEAEVLTEAGFKVTVISTRTLDLVDLLDHDILARARWRSQRVDFRSRWKWRILRTEQI